MCCAAEGRAKEQVSAATLSMHRTAEGRANERACSSNTLSAASMSEYWLREGEREWIVKSRE
eukprot:scaffold111289_cov15-Tisochrysis_lutea.AAC.1